MRSGRPRLAVGSLWERDLYWSLFISEWARLCCGCAHVRARAHTHTHTPQSPSSLKHKGILSILFVMGPGWQRSLLTEGTPKSVATGSNMARDRPCVSGGSVQPVGKSSGQKRTDALPLRSRWLGLVTWCLPRHKGARRCTLTAPENNTDARPILLLARN